MKKFKYIALVLIISLSFTNCEKFLEDNQHDSKEFIGDSYGLLPITSDIVNGFYDVFTPNETFIGFTVDVLASGGAVVSSGEVEVDYNGTGAKVISQITDFPYAPTYTLADVASLLALDINDVVVGDKFNFTFNLTDSKGNTTNAKGSFAVAVAVGCASQLGGISYSYTTDGSAGTTTGTGIIAEVSVNEFAVTDFSFGQREVAFGCCPGESGVSFFDTCGELAFNPNNNNDGNSAYTWSSVTVNGSELTIIWSEDYTSGTTVLVTSDGSEWPDLFL